MNQPHLTAIESESKKRVVSQDEVQVQHLGSAKWHWFVLCPRAPDVAQLVPEWRTLQYRNQHEGEATAKGQEAKDISYLVPAIKRNLCLFLCLFLTNVDRPQPFGSRPFCTIAILMIA